MKGGILLVDDEVAVLLTMKAILEISGFEVDTAASGREGKSKLHTREYHIVITDMRMESDAAGAEVITAARSAPYHPAIALLTAFPVADEDWQEMGADNMLVKPMHVQILLRQIEELLATQESKLATLGSGARVKKAPATATPAKKNVAAQRTAAQKDPAKRALKAPAAPPRAALHKAPAHEAPASQTR